MTIDKLISRLTNRVPLYKEDVDAIIATLRAAERMRNSEDAFELRDAELAFDAATGEDK